MGRQHIIDLVWLVRRLQSTSELQTIYHCQSNEDLQAMRAAPFRWLGGKIPVMWHQQGGIYLFRDGTVCNVPAEEARTVSTCPV